MTKVTFASRPYLLGFEQLDRLVERTANPATTAIRPTTSSSAARPATGSPSPSPASPRTTLAITLENNQLVIRGRQAEEPEGRVFLHRGIAARQFQRSFVLADGVEVSGATLENGLLHVDLARAEPETIVQTIRINGKKP